MLQPRRIQPRPAEIGAAQRQQISRPPVNCPTLQIQSGELRRPLQLRLRIPALDRQEPVTQRKSGSTRLAAREQHPERRGQTRPAFHREELTREIQRLARGLRNLPCTKIPLAEGADKVPGMEELLERRVREAEVLPRIVRP